MYCSFPFSALSIMVTIVLSGIQNNNKDNKGISLTIFKVLNNLELKYRVALLIYILILMPFNYFLLGVRSIFGEKIYHYLVSFFYSLPINKKVYRLLKTLSLFIFYSNR